MPQSYHRILHHAAQEMDVRGVNEDEPGLFILDFVSRELLAVKEVVVSMPATRRRSWTWEEVGLLGVKSRRNVKLQLSSISGGTT